MKWRVMMEMMGDDCTASGFLEAGFVESRRHGNVFGLDMIARFGLGGRNVADGFEQAPVVEPVDPLQ